MASNSVISLPSNPVLKSAHDLYNCLQAPSNLIVVDARNSKQYKSQAVRTAVNVDWSVSCVSEREILKRLRQYSGFGHRFRSREHFRLFIYDECDFSVSSEGDRIDSAAWRLVEALKQEGKSKSPIYILEEGFDNFRSKYPYLVNGHPGYVGNILPSEIIPGKLFLGSAVEGKNQVIQGVLGIGAVVNCTIEQGFTIEGEDNRFRVAVDDACSQNIKDYFSDVIKFMRHHSTLGQTILVHCVRGISRSATIVILYLMHECDMNLKQAYDYVKARRPCINPNPKFLMQLSEVECGLRGTSSIRFKENAPLTPSTVYEWLIEGEWIPRIMVTKPT